MSTIGLLLPTFILSVAALFAFIWSQRSGLFTSYGKAAEVIFADGEIGRVEEPALTGAGRTEL